jgi:hypothetical protein
VNAPRSRGDVHEIRQLGAGGRTCVPQSLLSVAQCCNKVVCKLQTLTALGTTEKVIFESRTLFLGQSPQKVCLDRLIWIGGAATNLHTLMLSH